MLMLPSDAEASRLLQRLGALPEDRAEALAARPDPEQHPELWQHLERCHDALMSQLGSGLPATDYEGFPAMSADSGPVGLFLYVWLYLAALPATRQFHLGRGIPEQKSWETFSFLASELAKHRQLYGVGGTGRFGQWCPPLRFRGAEFELGRLVYDRGQGTLLDGTTAQLLNVHIPGGGRLSPESCDQSFALARSFFAHHFADEPLAGFVCHSWLLDPQLLEYVPERSNIASFLRRFELKPLQEAADTDGNRGDSDVLEYVFGHPHGERVSAELLASLPQETSLQRACVAHLRAGRHWRVRTGWILL